MPNPPRRLDGPGYSKAAFAEVLGLSPYQVGEAVKRKQIRTVQFGSLERIPKSEAPRIAELLGLELREPPAGPGRPRKGRLAAAE